MKAGGAGAARHTEARCRSRSWCWATPTTDNWLLHNLSYHHHSHTTTYLAFRTCTGNYFLLSIYLHPFLRTLSSMMLYCMITISRTLCTTALPPLTPALTYSTTACRYVSVSRPLEATDLQGIETLVSVHCTMQCNALYNAAW